ncbi:MAG: Ig-like domain-containing protein, partial [Ruminococcus sp.]
SINVTTVFAAPQKSIADFTVENVSNGIKITLNNKNKYATYVIYRKASTSKYYEEIKAIKNLSQKSFVDKKVQSSVTYNYKVSAINYIVVATKVKTVTRLNTPTDVKVESKTYKDVWGEDIFVSGLGQEYVDQLLNSKISVLSWNKVKGAKSYNIYRAKVTGSKTGEYKKINSKVSQIEKNKVADTSVVSGMSYKYKVQAVKGKYKSTLSKSTKSYTFLETPRLASALTADYDGIKLSWVVDGYVSKYEIYRKSQEDSTYKLIKTLKGDEIVYDKTTCMLNYVDKNVVLNTYYSYYVKMYVANKSIKSNTVGITFQDVDVLVKVGESDSTYKKYYDEIYNTDATLLPLGVSRDVTFSSENEDVATVTKEGIITGVSAGETTVIMVQSSAPVIPNPTTTYKTTKIKVRVTEV